LEDTNITRIFPVITTSRLILRELTIEDAAVLHTYWSDPEVLEYLSLEPFANIQESLDMIEILKNLYGDNQGARWVITAKDSGKVLGTCGFHNFKSEHCRVEMGYELGKEYWRQGIMTEALQAIIHYGFATMQYNRIEAFVNFGNIKSQKILEKNGFKLDGLLREYEFNRGKFVDQYCYSLLKSEHQV
jgi:ribosomal-protein-alanine N-acetyltransferase